MANTVDIRVLERGQRNLIIHVFLKSDGASGDLVNQEIAKPADFGYPTSGRFELRRIDHSFSGFNAIVQFNSGAVDPTFKWALSEHISPIDLEYMGGIRDTSGLDGNGALQITTFGFTNAGDFGSILFKLRMPD